MKEKTDLNLFAGLLLLDGRPLQGDDDGVEWSETLGWKVAKGKSWLKKRILIMWCHHWWAEKRQGVETRSSSYIYFKI